MSSAAPAPPPHRVPPTLPGSNSTGPRAIELSDGGGGGGINGGGSPKRTRDMPTNGTPAGPPSPLPHISDLVYKAERRIEDSRHASIDKMLATAELSLKQSKFFLDIHRPDQAYVEYVVGTQIVTDLVRHAKDAPSLSDHPNRARLHKELIKLINADQTTFVRVRDNIKADNDRNRMTPTLAGRPSLHTQAADQNHIAAQSSQRYSAPTNGASDTRPIPQGPRPPTDHTRSLSYQGRASQAVDNSTSGDDALAERFAKLRAGGGRSSTVTNNTPAEYSIRTNGVQTRPLGPINTAGVSEFPKAPSPTYTPIRTMQSPTGIAPPKSSRNSSQAYERPLSSGSTTSAAGQTVSRGLLSKHATKRSDDLDSTASQSRLRRKSIHRPMETEIDAQKLFDYMATYSVLLVDVRSREDYDSGHIFASTGMCIEPTALRSNMSADELHEALVLSPQEEQDLFDNRDRFDLVVYYDQSSTARNKAQGDNPALVHLQEALYEYNQEKPLSFPPILLDGGLDSWVDMMGPMSLGTSNTAHRPRAPRTSSKAHASSRIDLSKRRHREYNPLAPEEEQKWRERARSESIVLDQQPQRQDEPAFDIDDFSRRFPDVAAIELASSSQRASPEPSRIPTYPKAPTPSQAALPPPPPPPPRQAPPPVPPVPPVPSRPPPAIARPSYSGVSERSSSQPNVLQKAPKLAPYIPPRLKRVPRVGLHNFGATCYMNSTIQCLSATVDLTAVFLDGQYKREVQTENWKGSRGLMPELYCILLRNLWESNDVDTIRPTNFRKFCARLNKEWGTDRQQDAKEFFDFLVDILHEDLNVNWKHNPLRPLTTEEEARRERTPPFVASKLEWDRYVHRDKSRLTDLFAGQHISRLQCTTCRHTSTTYEAFYSISVEIPQSSRPINIYDCLKSYCSAETLSGDEVWKCPNCNCEREATKRITITRAPLFLVIHLKRFSASHSERARKIHTAVDFPLKGLDLQQFILPPPNEQQREYISRSYDRKVLDAPGCMVPPFRYDAYAVTRHLGQTMASGHYIGLVQDRARGCWREFNDEKVTDFKPDDLPASKRLQNEQAYILFYHRAQGV